MSDEEFVDPILPIVSDAPKPPQKEDDIPAPKPGPQKPIMVQPQPHPVEPLHQSESETNRRIDEARRLATQPDPNRQPLPYVPQAPLYAPPAPHAPQGVAGYEEPDPWARVPIDTYWFSRTWARSPNRDEYRPWEFELVTVDNRNQQGRMLARIDGPYELALDRAKMSWAKNMPADVRATKIMVLSS